MNFFWVGKGDAEHIQEYSTGGGGGIELCR